MHSGVDAVVSLFHHHKRRGTQAETAYEAVEVEDIDGDQHASQTQGVPMREINMR